MGFETLATICIIISIVGAFIYGLVLLIKSANKLLIIIYVVNLVVGWFISCFKNTIVGVIIGCILSGIDYYVGFYAILSEVNKVSLLLFWSDLWFVLFIIYITIERYINGESIFQFGSEFDLGNFIS
ncbi:11707_t:CDS:1 [Funneliformis geosporum]|uniref:11707_t:CDS:1 n=1 Tax=Funneliformis geosporum TaxID=1117311 RepID=A0A9W4SRK6_9GLOM|nr:11707_t:CDS:1 [Funneliformis geosporum]